MASLAETAEESDFSPRKLKLALICLFGMFFGSSLLPLGTVTQVMLPLSQEFGWSRTGISAAVTVIMWTGAMASPFLGWYVDRTGIRPTTIVGMVLVALSTAGLAFMTGNIMWFYACFAGLGVFGASIVGYMKLVGSLFTRNRGKALAIFGAESTLAMALAPQLIRFLMNEYGWRGMYLALALIILVMTLIAFAFLGEPVPIPKPTIFGKLAPAGPARADGGDAPALPGMTIGQAARTKLFWLLLAANIAGGFVAIGLAPHMVAVIVQHGLGSGAAVTSLTVGTVAGVFGQLLGGTLLDRIQTPLVAVPFALLTALGLFLINTATGQFGGVTLLMVAAMLLGFATGARMGMVTYFNTRYFGLRYFAAISGTQTSALAIVTGFSPIAIGWVFDRTGSYDLAFLFLEIVMVGSAAIYAVLGPYKYR